MSWQESSANDIGEIIDLLQSVQFPHLDSVGCRKKAEDVLSQVKCLVLRERGELIGWVGLEEVGHNWWAFDIAIKKEWQGKWDYQQRLKEVGKYVFTNLKASGIIGVCYSPTSIKLGIKCGLTMTDDKDPLGGVVLKLSREEAEGKWF